MGAITFVRIRGLYPPLAMHGSGRVMFCQSGSNFEICFFSL